MVTAHRQLREEVYEVLRGEHHWGIQRNHKAGPKCQVQVRCQLLHTHTVMKRNIKLINGIRSLWLLQWLGGFYPVEVMEDVCWISWSETRRWDTDDGRVVRNLHLLLHLWQVVWLALSFTSNWCVELHHAVIQPLEDTMKTARLTNIWNLNKIHLWSWKY